jgi:hypothetical protein
MPTINPSDLRFASREKPPTGENGVSDWVWVDAAPWGGCFARYHAPRQEPAEGDFWEERESGRPIAVITWASRWTD